MKTVLIACLSTLLTISLQAKEFKMSYLFIRCTPDIGHALLQLTEDPNLKPAQLSEKLHLLEKQNKIKYLAKHQSKKIPAGEPQVFQETAQGGKISITLEYEAQLGYCHFVPRIQEQLDKSSKTKIKTISALNFNSNRWKTIHYSSDAKTADLVIARFVTESTSPKKKDLQNPSNKNQYGITAQLLKLTSKQHEKIKLITPENRVKAINWLLENGTLISSANLQARPGQLAMLTRQTTIKEKNTGLVLEIKCSKSTEDSHLKGAIGWNAEPRASGVGVGVVVGVGGVGSAQYLFSIDQKIESNTPFIIEAKTTENSSSKYIAIITPAINKLEH